MSPKQFYRQSKQRGLGNMAVLEIARGRGMVFRPTDARCTTWVLRDDAAKRLWSMQEIKAHVFAQ